MKTMWDFRALSRVLALVLLILHSLLALVSSSGPGTSIGWKTLQGVFPIKLLPYYFMFSVAFIYLLAGWFCVATETGMLGKKLVLAFFQQSQQCNVIKIFILKRNNKLALNVNTEHGKTLKDAQGDVFRGLVVVEHACGMATLQMREYVSNVSHGVDTYSIREPLGVCASICPFNLLAMIR